jgi:hypothetical protein
MHFGENQLSRSLIGLSPLTTGHPPGFQPRWVRASTPSYRRFTLPMARSPRFGSRTRDWIALIGLAFATAPPPGLTSPHATDSQAHSSKGTPSPPPPNGRGQAPTDCRHTVSGTLSLPSRGTFHPSLTVLVHYRSPGSIQPYQVVLADSHGIPRAPRYSGTPTTVRRQHMYGALTLYGRPLACRSTPPRISHCVPSRRTRVQGPTTPMTQPPPGLTRHRFRLHPLSLATTHGITICFLFHRVLRCFTSPGSLHPPYTFRQG